MKPGPGRSSHLLALQEHAHNTKTRRSRPLSGSQCNTSESAMLGGLSLTSQYITNKIKLQLFIKPCGSFSSIEIFIRLCGSFFDLEIFIRLCGSFFGIYIFIRLFAPSLASISSSDYAALSLAFKSSSDYTAPS